MINIKLQLILLNIKRNAIEIRIKTITNTILTRLLHDSSHDCDDLNDKIFMLRLESIGINAQIDQLKKYI